MALERWLQEKMKLAATEANDTVKQFALETVANAPVDEVTEIRNEFAKVGVWAFQNPMPIFRAIQDKMQFSVLVGMRPNVSFHVGHLTLMRELCWLIQCGGQPIFVFAGYEAEQFVSSIEARDEMNRFGEVYHKFTGTPLPETVISFSDQDCRDLQSLEGRIAKCLSVRKILQLYGWDESISVSMIHIPVITAATFLLPTILSPEYPTLVLSDIHQVTHAEAAKIAAQQLKLATPSYSYRLLLPSLKGVRQRMSTKDQKSLILLGEDQEQIEHKMHQSFSGGCLDPEDQRRNGGNPHHCSFFKIAEVLQSHDITTQMYQECISGTSLCGECKKKHIPLLVNKI